MENLVFGIITIVFCAIVYFYSWKQYKQDNFTTAVLLLMLCGLALYTYVSLDFFLHVWDERYHALVAKNLMDHPLIPTLYDNPVLPYDYKNWTGNHIWLHKPPLPLMLMAGSMKIFGVNEIALRLPSIVMSTCGIGMCYYIGKYIFDQRVGYFAAFLFSINGLIIEITGGRITTDHIDVAFMFFIISSIFLTIRFIESKKIVFNILVGLCIGFAILTKWLTGLIILPIWILLMHDSQQFNYLSIFKYLILLAITILVTALPWQLYIFNNFPLEATYESTFNFRHLTEVIEGHSGSIFYFVDKIRINYGELIYLPVLWIIWKAIKGKWDGRIAALCVWFLVPFFIFSIAKTQMQGYLLFTAPALFIMTAGFYFMLNDYKRDHRLKWVFNIVLFLLIALPVRYGIERIKPFENRDRNPIWVQDLRELNSENIENGILLNYENPVEAMFYTDLIVYANIPEKERIVELMDQGFKVIINENNVPENIAKLEGVILKKLHSP